MRWYRLVPSCTSDSVMPISGMIATTIQIASVHRLARVGRFGMRARMRFCNGMKMMAKMPAQRTAPKKGASRAKNARETRTSSTMKVRCCTLSVDTQVSPCRAGAVAILGAGPRRCKGRSETAAETEQCVQALDVVFQQRQAALRQWPEAAVDIGQVPLLAGVPGLEE